MTAIEIYPQPKQELVLEASDYGAYICLGDVTIYIPGGSHEKRTVWLMGFWEQLTDYMANHTGTAHLAEYVQRAANQSGGNK